MAESRAIVKGRTLPEGMDYDFLRQKGLEHITQLASDIWTDHNIHDPGITILEVLSYAITELTYRTRFHIKDILARKSDEDVEDFFTARQILTCNPLTIEDIRLLIIDCDGVQDGWLEVFNGPAFHYRCNEGDRGYKISLKAEEGFEKKVLKGLYNVFLQLEEDDELGDLNTNIMEWELKKGDETIPVRIVAPPVEVEFPLYHKEESLLQILDGEIKGHEFVWLDRDELSFEIKIVFDGAEPLKVSAGSFRVLLPPYVTVDVVDELEDMLESSEADSFFKFYTKRLKRILTIIKDVYCRLHSHRNICEDYVRFGIVKSQEISLCADIELAPEADPEQVLARIFFEVDRFLAPPVSFYSLKEMLEKGKTVDEIFEGLVMQHGFVDRDELRESELKDRIHVSDLYRIILGIDGVVSVRGLLVTNYLDGVPQTSGERWCLKLDGKYHLNLRHEWSRIIFYKNRVPFYADREQVETLLQHLKAEYMKLKLNGYDADLDVPQGRVLPLDDYYSVQNDFPLVYGVGKAGLPSTADARRKAQARQLKAFLMFFDQLLASYLSQLGNMKNLLSVAAPVEATYTVRPLYNEPDKEEDDFPSVEYLLNDFIEFVREKTGSTELDAIDRKKLADYWKEFREMENGYLQKLREYTETEELFLERRSRFLDHLTARFAESFTDYAMVMYMGAAEGGYAEKLDTLRDMIKDKEDFLRSYPEISRDRARALKYRCLQKEENLWDSANVSGLKKRLSKLFGIDNYERRTIGYCEKEIDEDFTVREVGEKRYEIVIHIDVAGDGHQEQALKSKRFTAESLEVAKKEAQITIRHIMEQTPLKENYRIRKVSGRFRLELIGSDGNVLARCRKRFETEKEAEVYRDGIIEHMRTKYFKEGFHIFEHILFRPVDDVEITDGYVERGFVQECTDREDCRCPIKDYYSFRITVVLPAWSLRFRDMRFREFVEETIRLETPAHILPRICWINPCDMKYLEDAYREWLEEVSKPVPLRSTLQRKTKQLVQRLNSLTTVYPVARLTDCRDPEGKNITVLNQTILGTLKGEEQ